MPKHWKDDCEESTPRTTSHSNAILVMPFTFQMGSSYGGWSPYPTSIHATHVRLRADKTSMTFF